MNPGLQHLVAICTFGLVTVLSACGGGESTIVRYTGSTLVVDGQSYERRSTAQFDLPSLIYVSEVVFVGERPGQRQALETRLDQLGLTDRLRHEGIAHYEVRVPVGWEDQWVRALQVQPQVLYSWLNFAIPCCWIYTGTDYRLATQGMASA